MERERGAAVGAVVESSDDVADAGGDGALGASPRAEPPRYAPSARRRHSDRRIQRVSAPDVRALGFLRVLARPPADGIFCRRHLRRPRLRILSLSRESAFAHSGAGGAVDAARAPGHARVSLHGPHRLARGPRGGVASPGALEWVLPAVLSGSNRAVARVVRRLADPEDARACDSGISRSRVAAARADPLAVPTPFTAVSG